MTNPDIRIGIPPDMEDALEAIAALDVGVERAQAEKLLAKELNVSTRAVQAELTRRNGGPAGGSKDRQGGELRIEDPEPYAFPVQGSVIADGLEAVFTKHLALPTGAATVLSLWTLHAHAIDAFAISPILGVTSPEKRCGKSTLLYLLEGLAPRAISASNITAAALFRTVAKFGPTLLIDEADSFMAQSDDLRGVLNAGHRRGGTVVRTVGDEHEPRVFSVFGSKAIALIGKLPDTLADRSIEVRMRRRLPNERVVRLELHKLGSYSDLRSMAWRWAQENLDALARCNPEIPGHLHDRAADNWRSMLAVADTLGGRWPDHARAAAASLASQGADDEESVRTLLLADLRDQFDSTGSDKLTSEEIVTAFHEMDDRPWPEWGRSGRPLSKAGLARLLKPFGVRPRTIRTDGGTLKGYHREDLEEAWNRYIPLSEPSHRHNGVDKPGTGGFKPSQAFSDVTVEKRREAPPRADCDGVTVEKGGSWELEL